MQVSTIQFAQEPTNLAITPTPLNRFAHVDAPAQIELENLRNPCDSALYPAHAIIRQSVGLMTRKLSVTASQKVLQLAGTLSRRKVSIVMLKSLNVA